MKRKFNSKYTSFFNKNYYKFCITEYQSLETLFDCQMAMNKLQNLKIDIQNLHDEIANITVVKFQDKLKEISGIDISSIKSYKNILIQKTKNTSKIVSMDKFRNEYSRYFNIAISEELF